MSNAIMNDIQRNLSKAQAVPILGMVASPIKAIVSLVQMVVGSIFAAIGCSTGALFQSCSLLECGGKGAVHAFQGGLGLIYSLVNFISLGFVGYKLEQGTEMLYSQNNWAHY